MPLLIELNYLDAEINEINEVVLVRRHFCQKPFTVLVSLRLLWIMSFLLQLLLVASSNYVPLLIFIFDCFSLTFPLELCINDMFHNQKWNYSVKLEELIEGTGSILP